MSESKRAGFARSRFGNVVNAEALPWTRYGDEGGRYAHGSREAAPEVGASALGYSLVSLDPGKRSFPFHFHHREEEVFFVLEGRGRLRQGSEQEEREEEIELGPGDFVAFPAGTGVAHQFINDSDEPFVYLALSNRVPGDVAEFPDSDKILIRATRLMLRRRPNLDYFDGET